MEQELADVRGKTPVFVEALYAKIMDSNKPFLSTTYQLALMESIQIDWLSRSSAFQEPKEEERDIIFSMVLAKIKALDSVLDQISSNGAPQETVSELIHDVSRNLSKALRTSTLTSQTERLKTTEGSPYNSTSFVKSVEIIKSSQFNQRKEEVIFELCIFLQKWGSIGQGDVFSAAGFLLTKLEYNNETHRRIIGSAFTLAVLLATEGELGGFLSSRSKILSDNTVSDSESGELERRMQRDMLEIKTKEKRLLALKQLLSDWNSHSQNTPVQITVRASDEFVEFGTK